MNKKYKVDITHYTSTYEVEAENINEAITKALYIYSNEDTERHDLISDTWVEEIKEMENTNE